MNTIQNLLVALAFLSLGSVVGAQSEAVQRDFEQAKATATPESWEEFLAKHKSSNLSKAARTNLDSALEKVAAALLEETKSRSKAMSGADLKIIAAKIGDTHRRCRTAAGADRLFLIWDDASWIAAKTVNTSPELSRHSLRFPNSKHNKKAAEALVVLAWGRCQQDGSLKAYRSFLAEHRSGPWANKARNVISKMEFDEAKEANTIAAYEGFMKKRTYHKEALERLAALMYQRAVDSGTLADWQNFRERFRRVMYRHKDDKLRNMLDSAAKETERLSFEEILAEPSLERCETFLQEFRSSTRKPQVLIKMEPALFESVMQKNKVNPYLDYLKHYPSGYRDQEIRGRLDALVFSKLAKSEDFKKFRAYLKLFPKERAALVKKMLPFMFDWAKEIGTKKAYETFLIWQNPPPGPYLKPDEIKPRPKDLDPRIITIEELLEPLAWKKAQSLDWHTSYKDYLRRFPQGKNAASGRERLTFLRNNKAEIKMIAPMVIKKSGDKWKWDTKFTETGGKVGFKLTGYGWIYNAKGKKYGTSYNYGPANRINRGSVNVKAGKTGSDAYWFRGSFTGGQVIFTWSGEDQGGHRYKFTEKVQIQ